MCNAEEVLGGDQVMGKKKLILAAHNRLCHKNKLLSSFNHCTYEVSLCQDWCGCTLPVEINIAGPIVTTLSRNTPHNEERFSQNLDREWSHLLV
jgi:hypothetical protein